MFANDGGIITQKGQKLYFGKYRGEVIDNIDPLMIGRVRAKVPAVLGDDETGWALPCIPYAGKSVGFYFIPSVGDNIWIEFEGGVLEKPIWSGGFWNDGEAPVSQQGSDIKVVKTNSITIALNDDSSGSVQIQIVDKSGNSIVLDSNQNSITLKTQTKLSIQAQMIEIKGDSTIDIIASGKLNLKGGIVSIN